MATTLCTSVGNSADSPEPLLRRHLPRVVMPICLTYKTRILAIMLKIFHINRLDNQEFGEGGNHSSRQPGLTAGHRRNDGYHARGAGLSTERSL